MKQKKTFLKASSGVIGLLAVLAIVIAVNALLDNVRARVDLTEQSLYTLSQGTRKILDNVDSKVTLKFFFNRTSPEVPTHLKNYANQVEDLLDEYEIASDGNVVVEMYNPEPDTEEEEWAVNYGLQPQQTSMFGQPVYIGLVAVSGANEQVIPALDPGQQQLLEYKISRLIHRVAHPEKPAVGVLSSLPALGSDIPPRVAMQMQQEQPEKWLAFQDIEADYELVKVETDTDSIPGNVETLIVIHPKNLSAQTVYAVDQFLLGGGRLIVFVDPLSATDMQLSPSRNPMGMGGDNSSDMETLFNAWGIEFNAEKVVADPSAFTRVQSGRSVEDSLVWLSLRDRWLNEDEIVTSQLGLVVLPFAGGFDITGKKPGLNITTLAESSMDAGTVSPRAAQMGTAMMREEFEPAGRAFDLALKIDGKFKTAFPEGKPAEPKPESGEEKTDDTQPPEQQNQGPGLKEGESAVVVVGDADMIYDPFCVREVDMFGYQAHQPLNDNLNFFANTVDLMAGSRELINVRSRGEFRRPFEKVLQMESRAREKWQEKEEYLQEKLRETREQLRQLRSAGESQEIILNEKQRKAIERYQEEEQRIREELREVRQSLRAEIERLGMKIKIINIGLMPAIVALCGIVFALYRKHKTKGSAG